MKKYYLILYFIYLFFGNSFAQYNNDILSKTRIPLKSKNNFKNSYLYSSKHSFDVINYKLYLDIYNCYKNNYPKNFSAKEQITLKVDTALYSVSLDAVNTSLAIDSVKFTNGLLLNYIHSSDRLMIILNRLYTQGEILNLDIYYKHKDVSDNAFIVSSGIAFTNCEEERARCWFPCWDKPSDKATTDITTKVPTNVLLVGNGRLADSVKTGDTIYYHWISRDPMSTYLVAIAGANYYKLDIRYWHKNSNPSDSIPVRFYYNSYQNLSGIKDTILLFASFFSSLFGDYPFEKICYADVGYLTGGAMENQTLITLISYAWSDWFIVPHELAHHWFGDLVTCGTWADIWLNEGFATMCELLAEEHFYSHNYYVNNAKKYASFYLRDTITHNIPIYNPPGWYGNIIYSKPACVLYMLRNVIGDSLFFGVLKSYITDTNFIYKNAITSEFTNKLNTITGQDYNWFIDEWIYQPGHPKYQNIFDITDLGSGKWRMNYKIIQSQTNTGFFKMPVEIRVKFKNSTDTLLSFFNNSNNQSFTFDFSEQPDTVYFDPFDKIILKYKPPPEIINATTSICSSTLPKPINDLSWTKDTIQVSLQETIKDIEINLNINHSNVGDLLIRLETPKGIVSLSQFNGAGGQNYTNTIFDDSASVSISEGIPPYTGRFRPQFPLSTFLNSQLSGKWILRIFDKAAGNQGMLLNWCIKINYQYEVGINNKNEIVNNFKLEQNYPNPFNPATKIKYQIPRLGGSSTNNSLVTLRVYDILGREVETLVNEFQQAGVYEVQFPGSSNNNITSGIYFYKLTAGDFTEVKKMVMIK